MDRRHVSHLLHWQEEVLSRSGTNTAEFNTALERQSYLTDVKADIKEAKELDIRMIPNFMVNGKYVISGSYDSQTFTDILTKAFNEEPQSTSASNMVRTNGESCSVDGNCD